MVIARQHRNRVLAAELEPARQKGAGFAHRAIEDLDMYNIRKREDCFTRFHYRGAAPRTDPITLGSSNQQMSTYTM